MNDSNRMQIETCEERLRQAMLHSDVSTLDELLADDLLFTNHLGQLMTKQDDLKAHRTGMVKILKCFMADCCSALEYRDGWRATPWSRSVGRQTHGKGRR